jgi:hypothetical protein
MITEAILSIFLAIPRFIVSILPSVEAQLPDNVFAGMNTFLYGVAFILPVAALLPILIVSFSVDIFRVFMALAVRIKSFIPFMGD